MRALPPAAEGKGEEGCAFAFVLCENALCADPHVNKVRLDNVCRLPD